MIGQDCGWLDPSHKRLLIITFLKVYWENEWGKRFLEPDRNARLPSLFILCQPSDWLWLTNQQARFALFCPGSALLAKTSFLEKTKHNMLNPVTTLHPRSVVPKLFSPWPKREIRPGPKLVKTADLQSHNNELTTSRCELVGRLFSLILRHLFF